MHGGDTLSTNPVRDAALAYAARGWPVLALEPATGAPYGDATTDRQTILEWWARWPLANVGVLLGHGLAALAVPATKTGDRALARLRERFGAPGREMILSPDVATWLYRFDARLPNAELAPGASLLTEGVVAMPPSSARSGEVRWRKGRWFADRDPDPLPEAFYRLASRGGLGPEEAAPPAPDAPPPAATDAWAADLRRGGKGEVLSTFGNLCLILRHADEYAGRLAFDAAALTTTLDRRPLRDADVGRLREEIERRWTLTPSTENLRTAMLTVAEERRYNPVQDYLNGLRWDGVRRLDAVAREIVGVEPGSQPLAAVMLRKWFISAAARALAPGCKVDTVLVLVGRQNAGKSRFCKTLAGEWFSDTHMNLNDKDSFMQLAAAWISEWAEIESIMRARVAADVKKFLTSQFDTYRLPFARAVERVPRASVIVGTTNQDRFLDDETGSRRFWIVRVPAAVDLALLAQRRDALWAEAVAAYRAGEPWWLGEADEAAREAAADAYYVHDGWDEPVRKWLRANHRENYTTHEVATGALRLEPRDQHDVATRRIAKVLRAAGLDRRKMRLVRDGKRLAPTWAWEWPTPMPDWYTDDYATGEIPP